MIAEEALKIAGYVRVLIGERDERDLMVPLIFGQSPARSSAELTPICPHVGGTPGRVEKAEK